MDGNDAREGGTAADVRAAAGSTWADHRDRDVILPRRRRRTEQYCRDGQLETAGSALGSADSGGAARVAATVDRYCERLLRRSSEERRQGLLSLHERLRPYREWFPHHKHSKRPEDDSQLRLHGIELQTAAGERLSRDRQ